MLCACVISFTPIYLNNLRIFLNPNKTVEKCRDEEVYKLIYFLFLKYLFDVLISWPITKIVLINFLK